VADRACVRIGWARSPGRGRTIGKLYATACQLLSGCPRPAPVFWEYQGGKGQKSALEKELELAYGTMLGPGDGGLAGFQMNQKMDAIRIDNEPFQTERLRRRFVGCMVRLVRSVIPGYYEFGIRCAVTKHRI
jgi:hypothetical protein